MTCGLCPGGDQLAAPPTDRGGWAVGILSGYEVPGWLALFPRRHLVTADELTDTEAAQLGLELRSLTRALRSAVPAERVYTVSFGERLPHWHVLVMAVPVGVPPDLRGPALLGGRDRLRDEETARAVAVEVAAELAR
jgi:diadenosine tetraphosphate (Ap4A) HIT family hydrolase